MTPEDIQALSGAEVATAIAKEEGWFEIQSAENVKHERLIPGMSPLLMSGLVGIGPNDCPYYEPLPAYHEGAELGRMIVALEHDSSREVRLRDTGNLWEVCCYIRDRHVRFRGETLELATARAYLWLKTNEEKSDDSHAEMDINLARIDQLRGGEE